MRPWTSAALFTDYATQHLLLTRASPGSLHLQYAHAVETGGSIGLPASVVPAGVVQLQLELHPPLNTSLDEALLSSQQRTEHARDAQTTAEFVGRAKSWWAEFIRAELGFRARPVKVCRMEKKINT